ncbi:MAG: phosphoribosyltransferase family protein [Methanolobus sp.]
MTYQPEDRALPWALPFAGDEPQIKYLLADNAVAGKKVLIVDDIADTGKSSMHSIEYVNEQEPKEVRTAALQHLDSS